MEFEWHRKKAAANVRKHGVTFDEAISVFADPFANIFDDLDHSIDESRELLSATQEPVGCWSFLLSSGMVEFESSAHAKQQNGSARIMKRATRKRNDDLRPEYKFDFSKSRPNRFASRLEKDAVAVVLDPDVAKVFRSSESVNTLLRSVISAVPNDKRRTTMQKSRRKAS